MDKVYSQLFRENNFENQNTADIERINKEGKLIQYIGRILRTEGSKYVYDYRDKNIEFLEILYKKRDRYYKKIRTLSLGKSL